MSPSGPLCAGVPVARWETIADAPGVSNRGTQVRHVPARLLRRSPPPWTHHDSARPPRRPSSPPVCATSPTTRPRWTRAAGGRSCARFEGALALRALRRRAAGAGAPPCRARGAARPSTRGRRSLDRGRVRRRGRARSASTSRPATSTRPTSAGCCPRRCPTRPRRRRRRSPRLLAARQPGAVRRRRAAARARRRGRDARRPSCSCAATATVVDVAADQGHRPRPPADIADKDHAENVMIVDLVRNDLGARLRAPASVDGPRAAAPSSSTPAWSTSCRRSTARLRPDVGWPELFDGDVPARLGDRRAEVQRAARCIARARAGAARSVLRRRRLGRRRPRRGGARRGDPHVLASRTGRLRFGTGAGITWGSDPRARVGRDRAEGRAPARGRRRRVPTATRRAAQDER